MAIYCHRILNQWRRSQAGFTSQIPIAYNTIYSIAGIILKQYDNFYERGIRTFTQTSITQYYSDGEGFVGYILIGI